MAAGFLDGVALFAGLAPAMRAEIEAAADVVGVAAGDWLFRQGDPGDALFIVRSGRLELIIDDKVVDVLGPGAALGELALLAGGVRSASLRARRDSELLRLQRTAFDRLLEDDAGFAAALTLELARQLEQRIPAQPAQSRRVVVLAVTGLTSGPPVAAIASEVVTQLRSWGATVEVMTPDPVPDDAGAYGRLLDQLEHASDFVVLVDEPVASGYRHPMWSLFCLRQADRVLALVDPRQAPAARQDAALVGCDVAFWDDADHATSLRRWLDALAPRGHHFITRLGDRTADVGRLARRLTGRSLGVVLSGGGARGFAHIGALGALLDAGHEIDRVGGTSMGSLVGSLFALGAEPGEILERCRRELATRSPFTDYRVPRHSLIRGRKAEEMLRRLFGSAQVESTRRSLFTVSADLVTAEEVVHRRGPIVVAVGTSMSLPGLVAPVPIGSRLLVDGGVLNNLPVDVMAADDEGPIVAVDVMRKKFGPDASRRRVQLPSLVETLARSSVMGSWTKTGTTRSLARLVVTPELAGIGLLDFKQIDRLVIEGRRATEAALDANPGALR